LRARAGTSASFEHRWFINIPNPCLKQVEARKERLAWKVSSNP